MKRSMQFVTILAFMLVAACVGVAVFSKAEPAQNMWMTLATTPEMYDVCCYNGLIPGEIPKCYRCSTGEPLPPFIETQDDSVEFTWDRSLEDDVAVSYTHLRAHET